MATVPPDQWFLIFVVEQTYALDDWLNKSVDFRINHPISSDKWDTRWYCNCESWLNYSFMIYNHLYLMGCHPVSIDHGYHWLCYCNHGEWQAVECELWTKQQGSVHDWWRWLGVPSDAAVRAVYQSSTISQERNTIVHYCSLFTFKMF